MEQPVFWQCGGISHMRRNCADRYIPKKKKIDHNQKNE
jgi:hypothetical protein